MIELMASSMYLLLFFLRSQMILEMLHVLESIYEKQLGGDRVYKYCDALQEGVRSKKYKPLLTRVKCS